MVFSDIANRNIDSSQIQVNKSNGISVSSLRSEYMTLQSNAVAIIYQ